MSWTTRRRMLRGMMQGAGVAVALPFLDCFLDGNGTALASGAPLPVRFGTWSWGCGLTPGCSIRETTGREFEFLDDLRPLTPFKSDINYFSRFNLPTDGKTNFPHATGAMGLLTGALPSSMSDVPAATLDVRIADAIGGASRFRQLVLAATGDPRHSLSARGAGNVNTPETSALGLYTRVFGSGFEDPNKADFKPDPTVLLRQSVLSGVREQAGEFARTIGQADRARMDEFFTSIRQLEQQLLLAQQPPAPADACVVPRALAGADTGTAIDLVAANHDAMARLLAMALACNQTKVFSMVFSNTQSALRRTGNSATHHTLSHEEAVDEKLGYQPETAWFTRRSIEALARFADMFRSIREGDRTLLDNTIILAHSDTNYAKIHTIDGIPAMTIGSGGGRLRTGQNLAGNGDPVTRIGLTLQRALGVAVERWGSGSLETAKPIGEILV